jgi:hypothetical protein
MPRVSHQWFRKHRLVDLNCGWYAQMGVVDYHYLNSIRQKLTRQQQAALESHGHLGYDVVKRKLHHHSKWKFDPEGRDVWNRPKAGAPRAAISQQLDKPDTPAKWKARLKTFGPLIVATDIHYLLVVGVTPRSFYYLDSLTGRAAYYDFWLMNRAIGQVYCVKLSEVEKLFQAELKVAEDVRKQGEETSESEETKDRPRERDLRSDETSGTTASDESTSSEGTSSGE